MSAAQDLLDDQQAFITTLQQAGSTAIANAMLIHQFAPDQVKAEPLIPPQPYQPSEPPKPPNFQNIDIGDPGQAPELNGMLGAIPETFGGKTPTFGVTPPKPDFGTTPNQLPGFQGTTPTVTTSFDFPDMPAGYDQAFIAPSLSEHTAPDAPTIVMPSFDALMPTTDAIAPTNLDDVTRTNFNDMRGVLHQTANAHMDDFLQEINPQFHAQMSAIETQLTKYLAGGTGLNPAVEDAIYTRARSKNDAEARRVRDQAWGDAAARGFTLPTGALTSAIQQARQAGADNNAAAAREIVVMQAEMEQKNLQFAVNTSADLRKAAVASMLSFLQSSVSLTGQALDYAKSITSALTQVYDIQVKAFVTKLEAYKTEASIYDTKSRVAMNIVEVYKAQLQAYETEVNVDRSKIELYRAQIGTLRDYAEIYKTQVEAVVSKASLEKLKIDLFQSQVQAYATQVQAKTAEWQGYQARLAGEETKVKIFSAQVQAFNGEIEAFKAQHEATSTKIQAEATRNKGLLDELAGKLGAYEARIKANVAIASGNIETLRQHYAAHKGVIDHAVATEQMKLEGYKANVSAALANAKFNVDAQVANAGTAAHTLAALADVHGEILKIYSGPASAAAAGMNSLASISYQE